MKIVASLIGLFLMASFASAEITASQILKNTDDLLDMRHSAAQIEMKVYRDAELKKTYSINLKYQDWNRMLAETTYPPRNNGEAMLRSGANDVWLYLPKINKTMRISESNSFSNSDFSNMDIMKQNLSDDYIPTLMGSDKVDGEDCYKLQLLAKSESVTYAKIIYWIRKTDFYPLKRDYYTFSGNLLKQLVIQTKSDVRAGKPDTFLMSSALEKGKQTILRYTKYEGDKTFSEDTFRSSSLIKRK